MILAITDALDREFVKMIYISITGECFAWFAL